MTIDGETVQEGASPIKIEIGKELTLGYTGREADGAASRGVEIDEGWVGGKVAPLDINHSLFLHGYYLIHCPVVRHSSVLKIVPVLGL